MAKPTIEIRTPRNCPSAEINPFLAFIPSQNIAVFSSYTLESGQEISECELAYRTFGVLNDSKDNCLVICHALTGSSDVEDWWGPMMGAGLAFDPTRYFIFCANVLGSPYGSSSPVSINPETKKRWGPEFPATSIRDDVRLHKLLLDHLGVKSVAAVIGGSMGGMAVLEWPLSTPSGYVRNIVPIATSARHSAWGISWGEAQRQSIYSDPKYNDGYYEYLDPPSTGLAAARMAALLTYRTRDSFQSRFGRKEMSSREEIWTKPKTPAERALAAHNNGLKRNRSSSSVNSQASSPTSQNTKSTSALGSTSEPRFDPLPREDQPLIFSAQSYLRYQGDKFVSRFDANCYISITRKMDTHDLCRGNDRDPWPDVFQRLPSHTLILAISSDGLFTVSEMQEIADNAQDAQLLVIESPEGHDGFLLEFERLNNVLVAHLQSRLPEIYAGQPLQVAESNGSGANGFAVARSSVFGEAEAEVDITNW